MGAKGKNARSVVFRGGKAKTATGMTKDKLIKNKNGRIVSKAQSTRAKRNWANSGLKKWADAVKAARKALNLTGFVAIGGKSATGKCSTPRPRRCSSEKGCLLEELLPA